MPLTHWMLYFKMAGRFLCKRRFGQFDASSEFRPGAYAVFCSNIKIGKNIVIRPQSMLFAAPGTEAGIVIEDDVLLGAGVHIYVTKHKFSDSSVPIIKQGYEMSRGVLIKSGSWIGANSVILPGVTIGKNSVIGAGSVVTKSVPEFVVAAGNPCRIIRKIECL